jgi:hypothetical protein
MEVMLKSQGKLAGKNWKWGFHRQQGNVIQAENSLLTRRRTHL